MKHYSNLKHLKASTLLNNSVRKYNYTKLLSLMRKAVVTVLHKCWIPLAIIIILMAIMFSVFRAFTPWVKQYKHQIEQHLSKIVGQPVNITDLETSWYWFEPVLKMDQVTLSDAQDHVLKLNKLLIGINVLSSLWHWQIQPGVLYVEDVHLTVRQVKDHWDVDGLSQTKQVMTFEQTSYLPILSWLLSQQKIVIKNVSALVCFSDGSLLPLANINFTAVNAYGHYRFNGNAQLMQTIPTRLAVIADLQLNAAELNQTRGHAYVSVQNLVAAQWRGFLPK
jgi:uncharacterized protein YhdP